jgi:transcriptional regulator with XRE-family HTH domain
MVHDINKIFGKKVAEMRKNQNLSQEELADRCGVHRTYIGSIERGEKSPTLNTIEKIANGLNTDIFRLFSDYYQSEKTSK